MGRKRNQIFEMTSLATKIRDIATQLYGNTPGTYLEAGANDGLSSSNTYALELLGWTGILVEPSSVAFEKLEATRPSNILIRRALSSGLRNTVTGTFSSGSLTASASPGLYHRDPKRYQIRGISRLSRVVGLNRHSALKVVQATTLDSILGEHLSTRLDLLVLDVEGLELEALLGLQRFRPRIIILETRKEDSLAIAAELLDMGYACAANLSGFSKTEFPAWTEDHQDFGWCLKNDVEAIQVLSNL